MIKDQFVQTTVETPIIKSSDSNAISAEQSARIYFDPQEAMADFDAEARREPGTPVLDARVSAYIKNAQILMKHKEFPLAMNILRQASNVDSKNPITLNLLATCLENGGKIREALIARKTLAQIDYNFDSIYKYATALYKSGNDGEALDKYFEALAVITEENESLFDVYKNMGNIFVRQGDFDGAEEYYNKAYTLNPQSDVLLVNFGTLEVQRNDFEKSLYCFRKAVEVNPQNDKAWVGLAMVHNQRGDADLAWANIEAALDINPQNRTAVHLAANWGLRDDKTVKATELLQSYLATVEEDEDMSLVLINLFCSSGMYDRALLEMERVLLWNPAHTEVRDLKRKIQAGQKVA